MVFHNLFERFEFWPDRALLHLAYIKQKLVLEGIT